MSEENTTLIGMVALKAADPPELSGVMDAFAALCPEASFERDKTDKGTAIFKLDGNMAAVSLMPAPIPWSELDGPCATAWWWPDATEQMQPHVAHVIVALLGNSGTVLKRHIQLSKLVAAIAQCSDSVGIYWGAGTVVHEAAEFQAQAKGLTVDNIEPQLWVDLRLEQNEDQSFRFFTTGMAAFDQLEVEIDRVTLQPSELLGFCYSIVSYILTSGVTIQDGETIGRTEDEKVQVTHEGSMFDHRGDVLKLSFP